MGLQDAGFEEAQIEAVVATVGSAIVGSVVTGRDLIEARNQSFMDLQTLVSELRSEIQSIVLRFTIRRGALIVAGMGLTIALDKLP